MLEGFRISVSSFSKRAITLSLLLIGPLSWSKASGKRQGGLAASRAALLPPAEAEAGLGEPTARPYGLPSPCRV